MGVASMMEIVNKKCPRVKGNCDYDLRRYALEDLEDLIYTY